MTRADIIAAGAYDAWAFCILFGFAGIVALSFVICGLIASCSRDQETAATGAGCAAGGTVGLLFVLLVGAVVGGDLLMVWVAPNYYVEQQVKIHHWEIAP